MMESDARKAKLIYYHVLTEVDNNDYDGVAVIVAFFLFFNLFVALTIMTEIVQRWTCSKHNIVRLKL